MSKEHMMIAPAHMRTPFIFTQRFAAINLGSNERVKHLDKQKNQFVVMTFLDTGVRSASVSRDMLWPLNGLRSRSF